MDERRSGEISIFHKIGNPPSQTQAIRRERAGTGSDAGRAGDLHLIDAPSQDGNSTRVVPVNQGVLRSLPKPDLRAEARGGSSGSTCATLARWPKLDFVRCGRTPATWCAGHKQVNMS